MSLGAETQPKTRLGGVSGVGLCYTRPGFNPTLIINPRSTISRRCCVIAFKSVAHRKRMRKILVVFGLLVCLFGSALADTLYLKNGSVLKGRFIGFENNQFVFELDNGRRLNFRPAEVTRLVIEREPDRRDDRYPVPPRGGSGGSGNTGGGNTGTGWEPLPAFDVRLEEKWYRTSLEVRRGQRIRVEASGTIYLDGRTQSGPDGVNRRDQDAPLPDENDGALIAAIGQDPNSPPILIGRSREFVADADGPLYFTVNHWETRDARGQYRVNVSVDRNSGSRPTQGREKTITISATQPWTDTGIDVEPGMTFEFLADGEIEIGNRRRAGADGDRDAQVSGSRYPIQDEGVGALIAKIRYRDGRDSNFVFIGDRGNAQVDQGEYGRLFLGINDDYFRDNNGSFRVTIRW